MKRKKAHLIHKLGKNHANDIPKSGASKKLFKLL